MQRKIAAGNWKMNGVGAALDEISKLAAALPSNAPQIVICPPAPLLHKAVEISDAIAIGAQDCHAEASGAYTGDISAAMIADTGASFVIVGHSERRDAHHETSQHVCAKAQRAWQAGLTAIICIGESEAERAEGTTLQVLDEQLTDSVPEDAKAANTVVAYEPIWAIGTGKVPTLDQIIEVHDFLRKNLVDRFGDEGRVIALLYGGSVKADNAATIFEAENVNGALVGGASLKASDFAPIIKALADS